MTPSISAKDVGIYLEILLGLLNQLSLFDWIEENVSSFKLNWLTDISGHVKAINLSRFSKSDQDH